MSTQNFHGWSWMVGYAAVLLNRCNVSRDGFIVYRRLT